MRNAGLRGVCKQLACTVTADRFDRERPTPDWVNRRFQADGLNQRWVGDFTCVPTWSGFIHLAVVLYVWSRRVVGWLIGEDLRKELVIAAMDMARAQRKGAGVVHHSDQSSEYTGLAFGRCWKELRVKPSMGSVGDAYENAMAVAANRQAVLLVFQGMDAAGKHVMSGVNP
jgi:putative transposase